MNVLLDEQRRDTRAPIAVCAWIDFRGESKSHGMTSVDLSTEGARFITMRRVEEGDPVLIRLQLHTGSDPVECKGRIVWCRPLASGLHHFAVRFVDLCEDEQGQIHKLVESYFKRAMVFSLAV